MPSPVRRQPDPDLVARLARLGVSVGTEGITPPAPRGPDSDSDALLADGGGSPAVLPIEVAVPGQAISRDEGDCYLSTAHRALDEHHAGERLDAALAACTGSLADLAGDASLADMCFSDAAFLDTETTGLMGGAGTYAFLIGIGRYVGQTFQVRQFFMRDPSEESAQLAEVADWIAGCSSLVTFNGRSYDMPLLATRTTLHRRQPFLAGAPHLDLLPASRRLWRLRLESCALTSLERDIFGLERQDDVPGWMIPYRYFRYQQDGDARPLVGIFHHNVLDILTMVSLVARVARIYAEPESSLSHSEDWFSLARAYERAGDPSRAMVACERALEEGLPAEQTDRAQHALTMIAKRAGDWEKATALWQQLSQSDPPPRLYPFEELAKYWEHRAEPRDLAQALVWSNRAREAITSGSLRPRRGPRTAMADLDHRIARLERRIERGSRSGAAN